MSLHINTLVFITYMQYIYIYIYKYDTLVFTYMMHLVSHINIVHVSVLILFSCSYII